MRILVTGITGLLGSNVARILSERGCQVRGLIRPSSNEKALEGIDYEKYTGDILNPGDVKRAAYGCQVIIHAAANTNQAPVKYENHAGINLTGTQNVLDSVIENKTEKLIYVSTANTFGKGTKKNPGTEANRDEVFGLDSGYIKTKYIAQQLVLDQVKRNHVPAVVVNPTFMIGPRDVKPSSGSILLHTYGKKVVPCPPGGKNFVHVQDVATGIVNAIDNGQVGECYLLANENLAYKEFFEKVSKITGMKQFILHLPATMLKTVGIMGTYYNHFFNKAVTLNDINARLICSEFYYSSKKARKKLKMPQTSINKAIQDALDWFYHNGYLKNVTT